MGRLEMIDDLRKYANLLMQNNPQIDYADATRQAKLELFGEEIDILKNVEEADKQIELETEEEISYGEIAAKELEGNIRVDLYTDEQLKEIIIAKRMGVAVEEFVNIFYTPLQIRVITLASALGRDITPYTTNLYFNPEEEMRRLEENSGEPDEKDKTYLLDKAS